MAICRSCGREHEVGTTICPHTSESVNSGPCGTTIDRYQIETRLGGGGFGSVYRAKHTVLGQDVAIKILLQQHARNKEVAARFVREAKSAAAIKSTHIVSVTDFGTTAGNEAFLVMELLDGRDLETILHEEGKFAVEWALRFTEQILEGLSAAHAKGVVHRDMKPANVFVTRASDGAPWIKLVDFGISKAAEASDGQNLTRTGAVIGTPSYMSPEQFSGMRDVDHRTDLYAVAVILYQMLSGRLPYEEETYERLILRVMTEGPKPLREVTPGLPASIYALVEKGLAREPADRFQSAAEFKEAAHRLLTQISGGARISVPPPSAVSGPSQAYASSHMHTPQMHTPPPGHFTPQQQDQSHPGQHVDQTQPGSPHFTPAPYGHAPQHQTPASQHITPQPLYNTPASYGQQPSTPMAFDRPMSTTQKSGPSGVLIAFLILCGVGVLALVAVILIGVLSEESDESEFATPDSEIDTSTQVQIDGPGVSNADPVLLNRVQSVLGLCEGDFNACRVPGYLAHTQVNVVIVKAQITVPPPMTGSPDEQVAQCLGSAFAQRANGTGPWFYPDGTAVSFNALVPPQ